MWFNPFMTWLIYSPFHRLLSKNFMTLSYTGRKSGKSYQVPVNYTRQGDRLVTFSYRERTWWRNLRGGALVVLRLEGNNVSATSRVMENDAEVTEALTTYLSQTPQMAKYFQVKLDSSGAPDFEDIKQTASDRVVILTQIHPTRLK
jgi:deazaflavin-dependent oxidoreductase (nitroreductase family)